MLRTFPKADGYLGARLYNGGDEKNVTVHRAVALTFLGPSNGLTVNHKNGNKRDNRIENLEWMTRSGNITHAYRTGLKKAAPLRGEAHPNTKLKDEDVREIRRLYGQFNMYELAAVYGTCVSNINMILKGRTRRTAWENAA